MDDIGPYFTVEYNQLAKEDSFRQAAASILKKVCEALDFPIEGVDESAAVDWLVGPAKNCPPRHPMDLKRSFLKLNSVSDFGIEVVVSMSVRPIITVQSGNPADRLAENPNGSRSLLVSRPSVDPRFRGDKGDYFPRH